MTRRHARKENPARHCFVALFLAYAIATFGGAPDVRAADAPRPGRIVSIHACADQLLLSLADRDQILALSPYAADPRLSFMAERARGYRIASASAEETLQMQPDLVITGMFNKSVTRAILKRKGVRVENLTPVSTIDEGIAEIRHVARLIGQEARGEALVARIERARDALRDRFRGRHVTALFLQRRGYVTGEKSLIGDILTLAGIDNAAAGLGLSFGGQVSLETVLATRPDLLIVAKAEGDTSDQGVALLSHPALVALYPVDKRLVMPERLTVCGGPALALALERFAAEADRVLAPATQ